jgi:hypothetical protein
LPMSQAGHAPPAREPMRPAAAHAGYAGLTNGSRRARSATVRPIASAFHPKQTSGFDPLRTLEGPRHCCYGAEPSVVKCPIAPLVTTGQARLRDSKCSRPFKGANHGLNHCQRRSRSKYPGRSRN